jgi:hypothetical protein
MGSFEQCEGEDLNLHGSYPASTSIYSEADAADERAGGGVPLGAEPHELLATEARLLLDFARNQLPIDGKRLVAFARACIELTPLGRLALDVIDGGPFSPRRALELASLVSNGSVAGARDRKTGRT